MRVPPKLAIFASGNGTNLQVILDQCRSGELLADAVVVVSDKKDAFALERARNSGVEALHVDPKAYDSREDFDAVLVDECRKRHADWIILAGFMRILSPVFIRAFVRRIVNIHPALLPKYPGTHAIEQALQAKENEIGVTVHFVDEGVDTGPIILQEKIKVRPGENLAQVTERIHELEHRFYPEALRKVFSSEGTMS